MHAWLMQVHTVYTNINLWRVLSSRQSGEIDVPQEGHAVGEKHSELGGNEVDVNELGQRPEAPVGLQNGKELLGSRAEISVALPKKNLVLSRANVWE